MPRRSPHRAGHLTLLGNPAARLPERPEEARLEVFPNPRSGRSYRIRIDCPDFTSLCPVTGQPDFAELTLEYIPRTRCVETKSLKLYLASYRNVGAFNEDVINRIMDDLVEACQPHWMRLEGRFTPRGGLGLTVIAEFPSPPGRRPQTRRGARA
jgi:7-cyano-7-deazaguanine reductase